MLDLLLVVGDQPERQDVMAASHEEKVTALKEELDRAVMSLEDQEVWEEFLRTVHQFGTKYSWGNQLLIMSQCMSRGFEPKLVMAYGSDKGKTKTGWLAKGRRVVRGQTGLQIWAPVFHRPSEAEAAQRIEQGQRVRRDADGRPSQILVSYKVVYVFDISQTEGADVEIPSPVIERVRVRQSGPSPELLTGEDTADAQDAIVRLIEDHGYSFVLQSPGGGANGRTSPSEKKVYVRPDVSPAQCLKTSVHELAHILCGHVDDLSEYVQHRGRMECEAESVAFIVLGALGMNSEKYSAPYVRHWSNGEKKVIEEAAAMVVKVAQIVLRGLEREDSKEVLAVA